MSKQKIGGIVLSLVFLFSVLSLLLDSCIHFKEFKMPGDAYECKYNNEEYQVIEGKSSACVIGNEENLYVVKKNQKWIVPFNESLVAKHIEAEDGTIIYVQQYNKLDDYYITVYSYGNAVNVKDNVDSNFLVINKEFYCTCVTNPEKEYVIYIDGEGYYLFK